MDSAIAFDQENEIRFQELLRQYPTKQAVTLPALWLAVKQWGHLTPDIMEYIAGRLGLSPVAVYAVVEFYTMFPTAPLGKHHIQLCRNLTCTMRGCEDLQSMVEDELGIRPGERTKDGLFSLELVECLGSCGTAPVMRMDNRYFEDLDREKLASIIRACREQQRENR